jgi:hypothetical protein
MQCFGFEVVPAAIQEHCAKVQVNGSVKRVLARMAPESLIASSGPRVRGVNRWKDRGGGNPQENKHWAASAINDHGHC